MFVVTGGAGFIGSNLIKSLNNTGISNILVVDDLTDGRKFKNFSHCDIADYLDKDVFLKKLTEASFLKELKAIFHQGACSTTTNWDGRYMMENNYAYSKEVLNACQKAKIPFIYASSAAVYGLTNTFLESPKFESPLNVYGYSKLQFDRYVRKILPHSQSQIVGLRYFNVFGPGEAHKGPMASVVFHFYNQLKACNTMRLFEGFAQYAHGEQKRDFIYVDDVTKVNLWFLENPQISGVFNVGTGLSRSFNDVAQQIRNLEGAGEIEYIPFPDQLKGCYQSYTRADINALRKAGYTDPFMSLEEGVRRYLETL